jgi:hypothetical protein
VLNPQASARDEYGKRGPEHGKRGPRRQLQDAARDAAR